MIRKGNRLMQRISVKPKQQYKVLLRVGIASCFAIVAMVAVLLNVSKTESTLAAATNDYRSKASGNWSSTSTWERYNGSNWVNAATTPSSTHGVITILNGHTVTVTANATVDQVVVEAGATLTISAGTLTLANGTGSDLDVSGTANMNGGSLSISSSAVINISNGGTYNYNGGTQTTSTGWAVNNGATYVHNVNGVDIPSGTWGATSTLRITGVTNTDPDVQSQVFGHLVYNCPNQTANLDFKDKLTTITGNFTVENTGTGSIKFDKSSTNMTLTVGGNYSQTGGTLKMTNQGNWNISIAGNFDLSGGTFVMAGSDGVPVLTVSGNINVSGGILDMSQYTGNTASKGIGTLNLSGNFSQTGGSITETATNIGKGDFNFAKTGTQTFSITGGSITNTINFTVNSGSTLDAGTNIFTGSGTFTVSSGGGLIMGSDQGISSSGATGNIQVTGTRTFSTDGNYTYAGTAAQITGTGLPLSVNNFTVNNSTGVTLSRNVTVTNVLTFTSGNVTTNSDTIILGTSQSTTGSLVRTSGHVVGKIKRWLSSSTPANILFPVGTASSYNGAILSFTAGSSNGSVTASFINQYPGMNGLWYYESPVWVHTLGAYGYWSIYQGDGMTGVTYSLNLHANSFAGIGDYTALRVIYRPDGSSGWRSHGVHSTGTGSNLAPVANRASVTSFGHFGIGGEGMNPLPVKLTSFKAKFNSRKTVDVNWTTSSEVNNDYFTVQRSTNGINFESIGTVDGAGNTVTERTYYFEDVNPLKGTSFYRLSQTDHDGTTEIHETVTVYAKAEVAVNKAVAFLRTSENAIGGYYFLEEDQTVKLSVFGMNGAIVVQAQREGTAGKNDIDVQINNVLPSGIYFLSVERKDGTAEVVRFVKN